MNASLPDRKGFSEMAMRSVRMAYGADLAKIVLDDCSFAVARGKLNVLIGPSGCGKTTAVNLLAGYERPTGGEILLDGNPSQGRDRAGWSCSRKLRYSPG